MSSSAPYRACLQRFAITKRTSVDTAKKSIAIFHPDYARTGKENEIRRIARETGWRNGLEGVSEEEDAIIKSRWIPKETDDRRGG